MPFLLVLFIRFRALVDGEMFPFTLVVRDPVGNSFIGSTEFENPADDPNITVRRRFVERFSTMRNGHLSER